MLIKKFRCPSTIFLIFTWPVGNIGKFQIYSTEYKTVGKHLHKNLIQSLYIAETEHNFNELTSQRLALEIAFKVNIYLLNIKVSDRIIHINTHRHMHKHVHTRQ